MRSSTCNAHSIVRVGFRLWCRVVEEALHCISGWVEASGRARVSRGFSNVLHRCPFLCAVRRPYVHAFATCKHKRPSLRCVMPKGCFVCRACAMCYLDAHAHALLTSAVDQGAASAPAKYAAAMPCKNSSSGSATSCTCKGRGKRDIPMLTQRTGTSALELLGAECAGRKLPGD